LFPAPKKSNDNNQSDYCPDEYLIHKTLFILFKGDAEKMNYFYTNKTEADLRLWIILHNNTQGYFDE
jgi:hypothetical protein